MMAPEGKDMMVMFLEKMHKKPASKGFTLIELLVVISIIAVLMSIMIPSLNSAREQAKKIFCSANMRSQSTAALLFAEDNDSWLPMTDGRTLGELIPGDMDSCQECVNWGKKYPQRNYWYVDIAPYMGLANHPYMQGSWKAAESKGIDAPKVFVCPSMQKTFYNCKGLSYGWNWNGMGYECKSYFVDEERYWGPIRASQVKSASITGMIGENPLGSDPVLEQEAPRHFWGGEVWERYAEDEVGHFFYGARHKGGSSYICVDGHIEFRKYEEYVEDYKYYKDRKKGGGITFPNPRRF